MPLSQDQPKTLTDNRFLSHFMRTRTWLEERLTGRPCDIWFTPAGVSREAAVKAEISALDEMIEHIRYQMESSPTEKEIWESARRFALSQQKFFAAVNTINEENTDSREYYDVLATHYKRMYLTLGIL